MRYQLKTAVALVLACSVGQAFAAGALAIDHNQGDQYGFSYDYAQMRDAEQRAIDECGSNCQVVVRFNRGCAAYAADQTLGSTLYGWAIQDSEQAAQQRALLECTSRGGERCMIRVWACESN